MTLPIFRRSLSLLVIAVLFRPAARAQAVSVVHNIPYTTDSTGIYHADLYQSATPGPHPAIVAIHGGSWRTGHKSELRRLCKDLAAGGYACFSIDYDTHPHSFPLSWQESRAAVAFLHAHAAQYQIDPDRIAVLGTSAGGQLAALLAVAPQGPDLRIRLSTNTRSFPQGPSASPDDSVPGTAPPPSLPVAAAVLFNGGYDLHPRAWLLRRYLGGSCDQIPAVCDDASPDDHIHSGAPPIFVGHGTHDHLIPYSQATTFISLLQSAHDPVTPFAATKAGHSYWRNRHWYTPNLQATEQFLAQAMPTR